jgi:hypothetical protein
MTLVLIRKDVVFLRWRIVLCYIPQQMAANPQTPPKPGPGPLYCPNCAEEVTDPLTCGDCSAVICRKCGTPLESPDELGIG